MGTVVVIDPLVAETLDVTLPGWLGSDHRVVVPDAFDDATLARHLADASGIITIRRPITGDLLDMAPRLVVVAKPGAGYDNIDVAAATARGVAVVRLAGIRGAAVAEHAFFLLLWLARHAWLRGSGQWLTELADELAGRDLGIVGFGDIGARVARIGAGFGMRPLVATRSPGRVGADVAAERLVDTPTCIAGCDVLVLCAPLTDATRGMLDRAAFATMRPGALLVNVARGPLVVTDHLLGALRDGRLGGAGLDVTDPEPLPADHPLRALPNVIITPHNAGRTVEAQRAAHRALGASLTRVLDGEPDDRVVNAEVLRVARGT